MAWARGIHNEKSAHLRYGVINQAPQTAKARTVTAIPAWDQSERHSLNLQVLNAEGSDCPVSPFAYIAEDAFPAWPADRPLLIFEGVFPKALLTAKRHPAVPSGYIFLSDVQRFNLKVVAQSNYDWAVHEEPVRPLCDLSAEISPRNNPLEEEAAERITLDCRIVSQVLSKLLWQQCAVLHQRFSFEMEGREFVATITALSQAATDDATQSGAEELWCDAKSTRTGQVDADTVLYLAPDLHLYGEAMELQHTITREMAPPPQDIVWLWSNDEEPEYFPVKKRMLQPCISLTQYVLSKDAESVAGQIPQVHVQVGCLTLDRVLLYLEQLLTNNGHNFVFDLEYLKELQEASSVLGCMPLEHLCAERGGEFNSRLRTEGIDFLEVCSRNAEGETLILIDGMVFDVTRWLPEHPGGSAIIPEQALNMDATIFFEMYHLSRRSFVYLEQFYIGDLKLADISKVPVREGEKEPSSGFLEQLRDFTQWRVKPTEEGIKTFKSF